MFSQDEMLELSNLSIYARIAYGIMCFENYVIAYEKSPEFISVIGELWHLVDGSCYIDEQAYRISELCPRYLYSDELEFINEEEQQYFISFIEKDDIITETILEIIYQIATCYVYTVINDRGAKTIPFLKRLNIFISEKEIPLPSVEQLNGCTINEQGGWGKAIKPEEYSAFIK